MSASKNLIQAAAGNAGGDFYPYTIENSARLDGNNYLYRTYGGNTKTFTLSFWCKRAPGNGYTPGYFQAITGGVYYSPGGYYFLLWPNTSAGGRWASQPDPALDSLFNDPSNTGRDFSAWYHYVFAFDSTQATSTDRMKVWVNGVQQPWTGIYPPLNYNISQFSGTMYIARDSSTGQTVEKAGGGNSYGYLAEMAITDGQYYSASDFGEFKNGVWIPKDLSGLTFGTKGFWLDFKDSSNFGNDVSGNNLDFTAVGFQTHDQMIDTPTNNFATLNPLASSERTTLSDGNLVSFGNNSIEDSVDYSTIAVTSGKWYWEEKINAISSAASYPCVGVARIIQQPSNGKYTGDSSGGGVGYFRTGAVHKEGSSVATYATFTTNDVIGVALDVDNLEIKFYKNGTLQGTVTGLTSSIYYMSNTNYYNSQTTTNFGQSSFAYTPPTGFKTLCTANLPEPTIGPNSDTTSGEHFNTVLYTGTAATNSVSGFGFQPDNLAIKTRSNSNHWHNVDAVRGVSNALAWSGTYADFASGLTSIDSDGFTASATGGNAVNASGVTYVAYGWKGNGSGVSNTDGSITSTVSANQRSGFSIVTYTGSSSGISVGHGLSSAPEMIIWKARGTPNGSARYWIVWTKDLTSTDYILYLNSNNAQTNVTAGSVLASSPTATTFSLGTEPSVNWNAENYVSYCFHSVEGFSKFGTYTGNGSATDGPFIYTGFRPAMIIFKRSDAANNWTIFDDKRDPYNVVFHQLYPYLVNAEYTGVTAWYDFLSNGFKVRTSDGDANTSGGTWIYMAFAENPFKYSNAR